VAKNKIASIPSFFVGTHTPGCEQCASEFFFKIFDHKCVSWHAKVEIFSGLNANQFVRNPSERRTFDVPVCTHVMHTRACTSVFMHTHTNINIHKKINWD